MKRFLFLALVAAIALAGCDFGTTPKSTAAELTSFKFEAANNTGFTTDYPATVNPINGKWTVGPLPAGTDISALKATFAVSDKATATVGGVAQTSGVTANNFGADVTYVVTAEDGVTTASYVIAVTRTAMGMTTFSIAGATMPSVACTIDDTASPRTITGSIRYKYRTELSAMTATFAHNGTKVTFGGTEKTSPATVDLSAATTVTVFGQGSVSESYTATITPAATAATEARISAFSATVNGEVYNGVIDDTAGTIALRLPSGTAVTALAPSFTLADTVATATVGATVQVSGTTTNDFTAPVTYVVTAEDGTTTKNYVVTVTVNPAIVQLIEFCPSYSSVYAQNGNGWFSFKVLDATALTAGWKIKIGYTKYVNDLTPTTLPTIVTGDVVRVHTSGYTADTDVTGKGADGIWDIACNGSNFLNNKYGAIWIEQADGTIIDMVIYKSSAYVDGWFTDDVDPNLALSKVKAAVAAAQWPSDSIDDAVSIGDATVYTGRLQDSVITADLDGDSPADWRAYQAPKLDLTDSTATPGAVKVTADLAGTILITAKVSLYGGAAAPTTVTADLSALNGTATDALLDDGTNGDVTANDGIYSRSHTIPAGTVGNRYSIVISTTGSVNTDSQTIDVMVAAGTVLFHTSFETSDCATITSVTGGDFIMDGETWNATSIYFNTTAKVSGTYGCGFNAVNDALRTYLVTNPGVLSLTARTSSGTANFSIIVQYSTDGTTWTDAATLVANGSNTGDVLSTNKTFSITINQTGTYYLRLFESARTGGSFYFDDMMLLKYEP